MRVVVVVQQRGQRAPKVGKVETGEEADEAEEAALGEGRARERGDASVRAVTMTKDAVLDDARTTRRGGSTTCRTMW